MKRWFSILRVMQEPRPLSFVMPWFSHASYKEGKRTCRMQDWRLIHAQCGILQLHLAPTQLQESWEMSLEAWEEQEEIC